MKVNKAAMVKIKQKVIKVNIKGTFPSRTLALKIAHSGSQSHGA